MIQNVAQGVRRRSLCVILSFDFASEYGHIGSSPKLTLVVPHTYPQPCRLATPPNSDSSPDLRSPPRPSKPAPPKDLTYHIEVHTRTSDLTPIHRLKIWGACKRILTPHFDGRMHNISLCTSPKTLTLYASDSGATLCSYHYRSPRESRNRNGYMCGGIVERPGCAHAPILPIL